MRFPARITFFLLILFVSCQSQPARKRIPVIREQTNVRANQQAQRLHQELKQIDSLLKDFSEPVLRTEEGIPYYTKVAGSGRKLTPHTVAVFSGTISDLRGRVLYDYRENRLEMRVMDYNWPSYMQKVLLGMRRGEQRIVYLPSSYAYRLSGDSQKIGSYCSIIINFRLEAL